MNISVVVSIYNEEESLPELFSWIEKVMTENKFSYEVVLVDDGSSDRSWSIIEDQVKINPCFKALKFRRNYGKSAALFTGFEATQGDVVITMDADLQDSPDEIPELYKMVAMDGFDIVSGWKKLRHDPISKTLPSKLYNWTVRKITGIKLHDMNCGLKAYRSAVVKSVEVYGDMHRYIPVLAKNAGFKKITEKIVEHRARKFGKSKFGASRLVTGMLDLLSVLFISKFSKKPMHLFGFLGLITFFIGFVILAYLSYDKMFNMQYKMTERPLFFLGLLSIIFGSQMFLTGFVAELISRSSSERNTYIVEKRI